MTAKDELRTMLDERGVEWRKWDYFGIDIGTIFSASGIEWIVIWDPKANNLSIANYKINHTAEQIIAATLGADECAIEHNTDGSYKCPKCGCVVDYDVRGDDERIITMDDYVIPFNHCPNCGKKVVDE